MRRYAPVRTMGEEKFLDSPLPACLTTSKGSGQPHFRGSPFLHLCHPERSLRSRRFSTCAPAAGVRNANLYSIEGVGSARFFGFRISRSFFSLSFPARLAFSLSRL